MWRQCEDRNTVKLHCILNTSLRGAHINQVLGVDLALSGAAAPNALHSLPLSPCPWVIYLCANAAIHEQPLAPVVGSFLTYTWLDTTGQLRCYESRPGVASLAAFLSFLRRSRNNGWYNGSGARHTQHCALEFSGAYFQSAGCVVGRFNRRFYSCCVFLMYLLLYYYRLLS